MPKYWNVFLVRLIRVDASWSGILAFQQSWRWFYGQPQHYDSNNHHKLSRRWYFLSALAINVRILPRNTMANLHYLLSQYSFLMCYWCALPMSGTQSDFAIFFRLPHFHWECVSREKEWMNVCVWVSEWAMRVHAAWKECQSKFIKCSFRFIWVARCWDSITIGAWPRAIFSAFICVFFPRCMHWQRQRNHIIAVDPSYFIRFWRLR